MLERLFGQLPDFARPTNPFMRYVLLTAGRGIPRRTQIIRALLVFIVLIALVGLGWEISTGFGSAAPDTTSALDKIFLILYWPLVVIQVMVRIFAFGSSLGVVNAEVERGTWDTLKVTTDGAGLAMKTRWAAVFYRLQWLLLVLLLTRLVFVAIALYDLTSFQGSYLDLLLSGTTPFGLPEVSKDTTTLAGILITAVMMTASLLAPFTAIAFDAGLGMFVSAVSHGRLLGRLGQVVLVFARLLLSLLALQIGAVALSLGPLSSWPSTFLGNSSLLGWLGALFGVAEGDMGLTLLHLPHVQGLWADRDYGALVGVAFLGYTLAQAALANMLVRWASQRAARAESL